MSQYESVPISNTVLEPFPWSVDEHVLLQKYGVERDTGLSAFEVRNRLQTFGPNVLPMPSPPSLLSLILDQFKDTMVIVLVLSALISFFLAFFEEGADRVTAFVEPWVIIAILVVNALIGIIQERKSYVAISALKQLTTTKCFVLRQKRLSELDADLIVPGDIIHVRPGQAVPADARLLAVTSSSELTVDQSAFSGENEPCLKEVRTIPSVQAETHQLSCMLFAGSTIATGAAVAVVTSTAGNTKLGSISSSLTEDSPPSPVQRKLDQFGILLGKIILVICLLVWILNIPQFARGKSVISGAIHYFKIAVSLGVAAIPEGLPAVITTCLALGSNRMAKKKAIVRHLNAVEALGSATVILTDKTGTLTTNQMTAKRIFTFDSSCRRNFFEVEGFSYEPRGHVTTVNNTSPSQSDHIILRQVAEVSLACNDASLFYSEKELSYSVIGDPTEGALLCLSEKIINPQHSGEVVVEQLRAQKKRIRTIDFNRERKRMTVITDSGIYVKGAIETVLPLCKNACLPIKDSYGSPLSTPLTEEMAETVEESAKSMASQGYRVLALAARSTTSSHSTINVEGDLSFIGLVGLHDPPRPEVPDAIQKCNKAGIKVVVVTGDSKETAIAIGQRIGLVTGRMIGEDRYTCISGKAFHKMPAHQRSAIVNELVILYRVEPEHKRLLVSTMQNNKHIVAMIGDGINDAAGIKHADIGISVGSGTAVAQQAADIVLADSNFATLISAIEEGRSIFTNMQQFIRYLVSSNIGEVLCIFFAVLLRLPEILIPVQLLWVNVTTDSAPATALSFNKADKDILDQPPRDPNLPIVTLHTFYRYMAIGLWVGISTVLGYVWWFLWAPQGPQITWFDLTHAKDCTGEMCDVLGSKYPVSIALSILVLIEMLNALNSISETQSLFVHGLSKNYYVFLAIIVSMSFHIALLYISPIAKIFSVAPLTWDDWKIVIVLSLPVILIDEVAKFLIRGKRKAAVVTSPLFS
ncbi:hypothetical protein P9112_003418 [Eukaryota sp. TZLM1-RC]